MTQMRAEPIQLNWCKVRYPLLKDTKAVAQKAIKAPFWKI